MARKSDNNNPNAAIRDKHRLGSIHSFLGMRGDDAFPANHGRSLQMNKSTSLFAAAIASLVVGLGFAAGSNAQSPMNDQAYCRLLVDKYTIGLKFGRSEVGNATAVAIAQCLEGNPGPAIPVLEERLRDADIPVPARS
ncbi:MAG TPA: hypothetical protein VK635_19010 [Bradyrhizobium sp.]|nr:hypothetical protein [Bradyrhizobium sp.]